MKKIRPIVVDDACKKVRCECLVNEDKRKNHREMVIDHNNLAKLVMETKQSVKQNQDDKACHDMPSQMLDGCVAKTNDLGEKLGRIERS